MRQCTSNADFQKRQHRHLRLFLQSGISWPCSLNNTHYFYTATVYISRNLYVLSIVGRVARSGHRSSGQIVPSTNTFTTRLIQRATARLVQCQPSWLLVKSHHFISSDGLVMIQAYRPENQGGTFSRWLLPINGCSIEADIITWTHLIRDFFVLFSPIVVFRVSYQGQFSARAYFLAWGMLKYLLLLPHAWRLSKSHQGIVPNHRLAYLSNMLPNLVTQCLGQYINGIIKVQSAQNEASASIQILWEPSYAVVSSHIGDYIPCEYITDSYSHSPRPLRSASFLRECLNFH